MNIYSINLIHKIYKYPGKINEFPPPFFVKKGFFIIELITKDGIKGYGEISSYLFDKKKTLFFIEKYLINFIKKIDLEKYFSSFNNKYFISPLNDNLYLSIKAAVDQALLDILGKMKKINSYKFFSNKKNVNVYSSGGVIFENQEYDILTDQLLKSKELKYFGWKFRPSIPIKYSNHIQRLKKNPEIDLNKLEKFCYKSRKIAGCDFNLMIDLGCRLKLNRKSIRFLEFLNELKFYFIEEPFKRNLNDYEKLKNIKNIAVGENFSQEKSFKKLSHFKQIKYFQPDTNIFPFKDLLKYSKISKKKFILHNWTNSMNFYSNLNFGLSSKKCHLIEINTLNFPKNFIFLKKNYYIKAGKIYIKKKNGLGIEMIKNNSFKTNKIKFKVI